MANAFEAEVSRSAVVLGLYYQKVPIPTKIGMRNGVPFLIKLKENDYDGFLVHQGCHVPLELKSQAVFDSFPLSNIAQHQIDGLKKMVAKGCKAYLLINQRSVESGSKRTSNNRAWCLDFHYWGDLMVALGSRKSIPVEMFDTPGLLVEIPRIKVTTPDKSKLVWDLRILLSENPCEYTSPEPWYRKLCPSISKGATKHRDKTTHP